MTRKAANGVAVTGWVLSFPVAVTAPLVRFVTGVPGSGKYSIYLCAALLVFVLVLIARDRRTLLLSLFMGLSAFGLGAGAGFVIGAALSQTPSMFGLGAKWALGG